MYFILRKQNSILCFYRNILDSNKFGPPFVDETSKCFQLNQVSILKISKHLIFQMNAKKKLL